MPTTEELRLEIKAQISDAVTKLRQFERVEKDVQKGTSSLMDTFAKMRDVMQGPVAAFNMVKNAIAGAYREIDALITAGAGAQKSISNFDTVLKQTGGVAGYTRSQMLALATTMEETTLFDDDAVRDAETALMRFRTVSGKTFEDVIKMSADLATVGGGEMEQYATALGKAFKGEEDGLTMLKRANIVLTEEQMNMAKSMYEAGDAAGAQKLILKELEDQIGGAANAAADSATGGFANMKKSVDELKESLGLLVAQIAQQSGATKAIKDIASGLSDEAMIKEAQTRWKAGGKFSVTELEMASQAIGRQIAQKRKDLEEMGVTAFLPGTGKTPFSVANDDINKEITSLNNLRNAFVSLIQAQNAAQNNGPAKESPAPAIVGGGTKEDQEKLLKEWEAYGEERRRLIEKLNIELKEDLREQGAIALESEDTSERDELMAAWEEYFQERAELVAGLNAELMADLTGQDTYFRVIIDEAEEATDAINLFSSSFREMSTAVGAALVDQEDGWKTLGKAGSSVIAGLLDAIGNKLLIQATEAMVTSLIPLGAIATPVALAGAAAAFAASGAVRAIPMAEGGSGWVDKPTLFLAGEAGPEPFAFGGANNRRGMGNTTIIVQGSIMTEREFEGKVLAAQAKIGRGF